MDFDVNSTGVESPVVWEGVHRKCVTPLSPTSPALASPKLVDMSAALASWESADSKNNMDSAKAKKVRFDEVWLHDVRLKECPVEHKVCLRDPMTSGTIEDFRTFVEAFPKALEMKVELKRHHDFGPKRSL